MYWEFSTKLTKRLEHLICNLKTLEVFIENPDLSNLTVLSWNVSFDIKGIFINFSGQPLSVYVQTNQ